MFFGIGCWPFNFSCLDLGVLAATISGAIMFAFPFLFEAALLFYLFGIPKIRYVMFRPAWATLLVLTNLVAGYFMAPHGQGL
jgi:hypothetical protein